MSNTGITDEQGATMLEQLMTAHVEREVAEAKLEAAIAERDSWRDEACRLSNETIPKMAQQAMDSIAALLRERGADDGLMQQYDYVGTVDEHGGGKVQIHVDRDLASYPALGARMYVGTPK